MEEINTNTLTIYDSPYGLVDQSQYFSTSDQGNGKDHGHKAIPEPDTIIFGGLILLFLLFIHIKSNITKKYIR